MSFGRGRIREPKAENTRTIKYQHQYPKKLVLVTDAMSAMGLGCGTHSLGSISVTIKNEHNDNNNSDNKNNTIPKHVTATVTISILA